MTKYCIYEVKLLGQQKYYFHTVNIIITRWCIGCDTNKPLNVLSFIKSFFNMKMMIIIQFIQISYLVSCSQVKKVVLRQSDSSTL